MSTQKSSKDTQYLMIQVKFQDKKNHYTKCIWMYFFFIDSKGIFYRGKTIHSIFLLFNSVLLAHIKAVIFQSKCETQQMIKLQADIL